MRHGESPQEECLRLQPSAFCLPASALMHASAVRGSEVGDF